MMSLRDAFRCGVITAAVTAYIPYAICSTAPVGATAIAAAVAVCAFMRACILVESLSPQEVPIEKDSRRAADDD